METLIHQDMQSLHEGIQQLYTFCDLDTFGVNALSIVDRLVPGDVPEFHVTNLNTHQISSTFLPNFPGFTAEMKRVMQKHFGEHPVAQHMPQTLDGVYKISDFISRQELYCLEGLYQQFLRLIDTEDQIIFFLPQPNPVSWQELSETNAILMGFSIHRTWGEFTERDRLVLNLLRPHLFQSHQNAQKYHRLQQDTIDVQQSIDGLCAIIVDSQGRIQSIAAQAAIWLEIYFPTPTHSDRLPTHLWSLVKYQTSCLSNKTDLAQARLPLRIQSEERELTIRSIVEPNCDRYMLLLEERMLSCLNSLEILGLSQRETEVLSWVLKGKNNQAIALQLSVGKSTVSKHLENIYHKLGVQSRTEAISRALEKLGLML